MTNRKKPTTDSTTALLLAFQPYRGTVVRSAVPDVATRSEIADLVRRGYLTKEGTARDPRYHFTHKAYNHLGEPKR